MRFAFLGFKLLFIQIQFKWIGMESKDQVLYSNEQKHSNELDVADYVVVAIYFLGILAIGLWVCWKQLIFIVISIALINSQQEEAGAIWVAIFLPAVICIGYQSVK